MDKGAIKIILYITIVTLAIVLIGSSILYFIFGDIEVSYQPMWRIIGGKLYYY